MSTTNNDDWFKDLADAANSLFEADNIKLSNLREQLRDNPIWNRLIENLSKTHITYKNATTIVDELKKDKSDQIKNLDFNDIKAKLSLLNGLLITDVASDQNGDKKLTYSIKDKISRNNVACAVVLITYIQHTYGIETDEIFAENFIKLTKFLEESNGESKLQHTEPSSSVQAQRDMTLILVFGKGHKTRINEIKDKKSVALDESDYELLENKCEWFWYGNKGNKPTEITKNEPSNMCWLELNINLSNAPTVTNILHIKDLIRKIKKQPNIVIEIESSDNVNLDKLDNKVFSKV